MIFRDRLLDGRRGHDRWRGRDHDDRRDRFGDRRQDDGDRLGHGLG